MHIYSNQSGNILFIILIAIGLFALLGSVVMDGESTTNKISEDKAKIYAQDIISYANAMETAVQNMLARGISETDLCFDFDAYPGGDNSYEHAACSDAENRVFSPSGGSVLYKTPPPEYFDNTYTSDARAGTYIFSGASDVIHLPQGTAENGSTELIMFVFGVKKEICIQINNSLNWNIKNTDPPIEPATAAPTIGTIKFVGDYTVRNQIGDTSDPTVDLFTNASHGCMQSSNSGNFSNGYIAYFVLHAR